MSLFTDGQAAEECFFLGEARLGCVAAVCDTAEGIFDRKCIERIGIVVAGPLFEKGMIRMRRICDHFEQFVEARDATAIPGWPVSFAADIARIGDARLTSADASHREAMLPAIAEVVHVIDDSLSRLEHVAQAHLVCRDERRSSPVVTHRQTVSLLADRELPEVAIEPSHDSLDDVMQHLERDRGWHLDLTPDRGIGVPQLDANSGDLVEAVGRDVLSDRTHHAASLTGWSFQFQGSS